VIERRNIINSTYVGEVALRVLGGVVSGGVLSLSFSFSLLLFLPFVGFAVFSFF
jgi:hypothetical protein